MSINTPLIDLRRVVLSVVATESSGFQDLGSEWRQDWAVSVC